MATPGVFGLLRHDVDARSLAVGIDMTDSSPAWLDYVDVRARVGLYLALSAAAALVFGGVVDLTAIATTLSAVLTAAVVTLLLGGRVMPSELVLALLTLEGLAHAHLSTLPRCRLTFAAEAASLRGRALLATALLCTIAWTATWYGELHPRSAAFFTLACCAAAAFVDADSELVAAHADADCSRRGGWSGLRATRAVYAGAIVLACLAWVRVAPTGVRAVNATSTERVRASLYEQCMLEMQRYEYVFIRDDVDVTFWKEANALNVTAERTSSPLPFACDCIVAHDDRTLDCWLRKLDMGYVVLRLPRDTPSDAYERVDRLVRRSGATEAYGRQYASSITTRALRRTDLMLCLYLVIAAGVVLCAPACLRVVCCADAALRLLLNAAFASLCNEAHVTAEHLLRVLWFSVTGILCVQQVVSARITHGVLRCASHNLLVRAAVVLSAFAWGHGWMSTAAVSYASNASLTWLTLHKVVPQACVRDVGPLQERDGRSKADPARSPYRLAACWSRL